MKRLLSLLILLAAVFGIYWFFFRDNNRVHGPKQAPLKVKQHDKSFNDTVSNLLTAYFDLSNAFVDGDTVKIKQTCKGMLAVADSFKLTALLADTAGIYESAQIELTDIKANAESLLVQTDITEMRKDFSMVNENLYPFLKTVKYSGKPLYWQTDVNAFGTDKSASWIGNSLTIINPYKGKNHPDFKDAQLNSGEIRDTIQ